MEVIPPNGKSPYIIKSNSPNLILPASVTMEGFLSPSKSNQLATEIHMFPLMGKPSNFLELWTKSMALPYLIQSGNSIFWI